MRKIELSVCHSLCPNSILLFAIYMYVCLLHEPWFHLLLLRQSQLFYRMIKYLVLEYLRILTM